MSPTGGAGSFFDQFIEDYYSECDEHLATARRVLLALEGSAAEGSPAPPMHELLRSLHTLKGLSGMVGDTCAEQVAHALEDAVRGIERADGRPDPASLDALFAGVDFPRLLLDAFHGIEVSSVLRYQTGVRCRQTIPRDIQHVVSILRDQSVARSRKAKAVLEFLLLTLDPRIYSDLSFSGDRGLAWLNMRRFVAENLRQLHSRGLVSSRERRV